MVGLVVLLSATYAILNWMTAPGRDASVAQLQEQVTDLLPELTVADHVPLAVRTRVPAARDADPSLPDAVLRWRQLLARIGQWPDYAERPYRKTLADHLVWKYLRNGHLRSDFTAEELAQARALLDANREAIGEMLDLAELAVPASPFNSARGPDGLAELHRYYEGLRACANLLAVDALMKALDEEREDAIRRVIAASRICDALLVWSFGTRRLLYDAVEETLREDPSGASLPGDQMEALLAQLAASNDRQVFAAVLARSAYGGVETWFEPCGVSDIPLVGLWDVSLDWAYHVVCAPLVNEDQRVFAAMMGRLIEVAPRSYYEAAPAVDEALDELSRGGRVSRGEVSLLRGAFEVQAELEARLDLMRMTLWIEQYRDQHGAYPTTLDALSPPLGALPLLDPFSGQPYHYGVEGDRFLLHSVGRNRADDGGAKGHAGGDLVWRVGKAQ